MTRMALSILVIDDEEPIRQSLRLMLRLKGYAVATAADGAAGLEALAEGGHDLVITDMLMPGGAGLEMIRDIRARDPAVRIIAMSGGAESSGRSVLELAAELGADAAIGKPFRAAELLALVRRCLGEA